MKTQANAAYSIENGIAGFQMRFSYFYLVYNLQLKLLSPNKVMRYGKNNRKFLLVTALLGMSCIILKGSTGSP